ncbi:MAG: hypothetical protein M0P12_03195 [Paludibacteraceae bacterium]|nr:hypothetical protein [Paludibacteraceae bacterium]
MQILFPWSKIIFCKKTAGIYLSSYPFPQEPQHHNGYFFREIEPLSFCGFEIPLFWTSTGNIWMPKDESEFDVICCDEYEDRRKEVFSCSKCLWFTKSVIRKKEGYCCCDDDGEIFIVKETDSCRKWENQ